MRRVSVVGSSGSGKTTTARRLASLLGVTHVELDAIFHQPGWTGLDDATFQARTAAALDAAPGGWVACGNYTIVQRPVVWPRADTVIFLDLPRSVVMWQILTRTLRRVATRQELWNGNRERWGNLVRWDPEHNVIRWSWTRFDAVRARYRATAEDPAWAHLDFLCLTSRAAVDAFLDDVAADRWS